MQDVNSIAETDHFFSKYDSLVELSLLEEKVKAFFKTLKNVKSTTCQIESDLDIENPDAQYLVCAVVFYNGNSKDWCFKVVNKNYAERVF